jgi:hypothetical protein
MKSHKGAVKRRIDESSDRINPRINNAKTEVFGRKLGCSPGTECPLTCPPPDILQERNNFQETQ